MNHIFSQQIGRNVEVYVDDILVNSNDEVDHLDDLRETFDTLQANPDKLKEIIEIKSPRIVKEA